MTIYGVSTYGRLCVMNEENDVDPLLRNSMLIIYVLYGIFAIFQIYQAYKAGSIAIRRRNGTAGLLQCLVLLYTLSHVFRVAHFFDHTFRPVTYREPKLVYNKYILTQMELTFYLNFPVTILGIQGIRGMINGLVNSDKKIIRGASWYLGGHIITCLVNFVHYTIEPFSFFSPICHFTIASSPIVATLFGILVCSGYRGIKETNGPDSKDLLSSGDDTIGKQDKDGTPRRRSRVVEN